jgi:hypothetical protein
LKKTGIGFIVIILLLWAALTLAGGTAFAAKAGASGGKAKTPPAKAKGPAESKKPDASPRPAGEGKKPEASPGLGLVYAADVLSVKGSGFRVKRISSPHWMFGRENMPNYVQDVLETDDSSVACIEFLNGSQMGIDKKSVVEITSTAGGEDITRRGTVEKIVLKSGTLWAKVRGEKRGVFQVKTSKGVLGVKGTEFVVESDPDKDTEKVSVLEGQVEFAPSKGGTQEISPGEEVVYEQDKPARTDRKTVQDLRNALNLRFPGLSPAEQAVLSVFYSHAIGHVSGASHAMSIANETLDMAENPERYVTNRAISEVGSRTGVYVPGGVFGGGGKKKEEKVSKAANLSPNGDTIDSYYPQLSWDKVDGAESYRVIISRKPLAKGTEDPEYYAYAVVKENSYKYSYSARALKPRQLYFWAVVPLNREGKAMAPPSDPARFTMADYLALGIRGLYPNRAIEPPQGGLVFDWTPVEGVKKYRLEVSTREDMTDPLLTRESEVNSLEVENAAGLFFKDRDYFWKVTPVEAKEGTPSIAGALSSFRIGESAGK